MLKTFSHKPSFTTKEAKRAGIGPRMLSYYVKNGSLERIARGIYRDSNYLPKDENIQWEDLAIAAQGVSGGVICLISALNFYNLTDEKMREHWIAVPHSRSHAHFPQTRMLRMRNMTLGTREVTVAGMPVRIFDPERTIVDAFRLLDLETAMKALKRYLTGECGKPDLKKLGSYAKQLRVSIDNYLRALMI